MVKTFYKKVHPHFFLIKLLRKSKIKFFLLWRYRYRHTHIYKDEKNYAFFLFFKHTHKRDIFKKYTRKDIDLKKRNILYKHRSDEQK